MLDHTPTRRPALAIGTSILAAILLAAVALLLTSNPAWAQDGTPTPHAHAAGSG